MVEMHHVLHSISSTQLKAAPTFTYIFHIPLYYTVVTFLLYHWVWFMHTHTHTHTHTQTHTHTHTDTHTQTERTSNSDKHT